MDAKAACDKLNGFNFQNRYLVVLYHQVRIFRSLPVAECARDVFLLTKYLTAREDGQE